MLGPGNEDGKNSTSVGISPNLSLNFVTSCKYKSKEHTEVMWVGFDTKNISYHMHIVAELKNVIYTHHPSIPKFR